MDHKVVQLAKKTRKSRKPPPPPEVDFKKVALLSAARMSDRHICLSLDLTDEQFAQLKTTKAFSDALEKGRADFIFQCAQVVMRAARGELGRRIETTESDKDGNDRKVVTFGDFGENEREQLKAAKEYLSQHAPMWMASK